jgi:hypothetical protein
MAAAKSIEDIVNGMCVAVFFYVTYILIWIFIL